jgi:hypothetical protein
MQYRVRKGCPVFAAQNHSESVVIQSTVSCERTDLASSHFWLSLRRALTNHPIYQMNRPILSNPVNLKQKFIHKHPRLQKWAKMADFFHGNNFQFSYLPVSYYEDLHEKGILKVIL